MTIYIAQLCLALMGLLSQANRLPGAAKYSHPALRQLAHMIVFGKIYRSKNPLPGHTNQTVPEFYGNPALRTTRPDTGIIFGASIVSVSHQFNSLLTL